MQELGREEIYRGRLINLHIETLSQPSGGTSRFEIVEHPGGVAIVALRYNTGEKHSQDPDVVLVQQKRPAIGKSIWEIPAGMVEPDERHMLELTAARELREETGYIAESWEWLIREYPSPGFSTETITIFLARQVHPASDVFAPDTPSDSTEIAQIHWMPLNEALAYCRRGEIEDGKTLLGLYLTHYLLMSESNSHTQERQ